MGKGDKVWLWKNNWLCIPLKDQINNPTMISNEEAWVLNFLNMDGTWNFSNVLKQHFLHIIRQIEDYAGSTFDG